MWVSQTYLTNLRADGAVSAYFLFESYRDDHARVERAIRSKLGKLALSFGDDAHIFVPSPEAKASIEKEFNEWLLQRGLEGIELPGVLVLQHPMDDERSLKGEAVFISFSELLTNPKIADALLERVGSAFEDLKEQLVSETPWFERVIKNVQLKPTIWGVGYDLKPHLLRFVERSSRRGS